MVIKKPKCDFISTRTGRKTFITLQPNEVCKIEMIVIWSVKLESGNSDIGGNLYYVVGNRSSYHPTNNLLALYNTTSDNRYPTYFQNKARGATSRLVLAKYLAKQPRLNQ